MAPRMPERGLLKCSFCSSTQRDVEKLIAGPHVYICDECVATAQRVLAGTRVRQADCSFCGEPRAPKAVVTICEHCLTLCEGILAEAL